MTVTTSPILVTGGTGKLGAHVVPLLRAAGRDVRVLSRSTRPATEGIEYVAVDLMKGEGIDAALAGVETVLHLAGGTKGDDKVTGNLVAAAKRADVKHIVYISVIGADTMPLGWFKTQLDAENAVTQSGIPWTMLRAAQFHDIVLMMAEKMVKMPIIPVPGGLTFQPVDSREVAARLVELTLGAPAGKVRDLAGPKVYPLGDLLRDYMQARGKKRPLMPMRMPGKAGKAYRAGDNLALKGNDVGRRTWEAFLKERVG
ncbi:SDR family oxidoreductase [Streptomyces sp. ISL-86]|uniref:SDR family oxidoreductase n=1 Tax=Streptomyces sp. ISL-86 TaxID=2819187 RepID=UPI001BE64286|nr:NAD(P)H-binding protein [Streptomyces sp. ISL-86]MBT2453593.1 NAD(P)H-binding protein [Streptomyces sp. ISL-86]